MPFALFCERLRKKLTVMGIMGHTQGVKSASSPPMKPIAKIYSIELSCLPWSPL